MDLAGGPKVSELKISNIINEKRDDIIFLNKPIDKHNMFIYDECEVGKRTEVCFIKEPLI